MAKITPKFFLKTENEKFIEVDCLHDIALNEDRIYMELVFIPESASYNAFISASNNQRLIYLVLGPNDLKFEGYVLAGQIQEKKGFNGRAITITPLVLTLTNNDIITSIVMDLATQPVQPSHNDSFCDSVAPG